VSTLYAGTSGFAYPSWKPAFYPARLPAAKFLEHYALRLNCVEINYTFRRTPSAATLEAWVAATPPGFAFAIKAHQRITHVARLKDAQEPTEYFIRSLEPLRVARRLGPVLFQLPPYLKLDVDRLAAFLPLLPGGLRCAFEFRHPSWFADDVYALLRERNISLCVAESETLEVPYVVTADYVYFRLRKPRYDEADIERFAARSRDLLAAGCDAYWMFKHEADPGGALEAEELLAAV
jgi:uncharacterized protein YecE (DUF72 family)